MSEPSLTYPGGAEELIQRWNSRREPFVFYGQVLPPPDIDLTPLTRILVTRNFTRKHPDEARATGTYSEKHRRVAKEFIGNTQLAYLNALLIANLRRAGQPPHAAALFHRLWAEHSDHLIGALDKRWLVSSVMTFADHGQSDLQRQLGQALRMLFGLMKLYEYERLFSGTPPHKPFKQNNKARGPLPLEMEPFSLRNGGLDSFLLAPVWEMARAEPVMGPLACHLLDALNADDRNVFRRLAAMRDDYARRKGDA